MQIEISMDDDWWRKVEQAIEVARPELRAVLQQEAERTRALWVACVSGQRVISGMPKPISDPMYAASIMSAGALHVESEGFDIRIEPPDQKRLKRYEDGQGSWDMKPALLQRRTAKRGHGGILYARIPIHASKDSKTGKPIGSPIAFRTVSEASSTKGGKPRGSKPGSWVHPGFDAVPVVKALQEQIDRELPSKLLAVLLRYV